MWPTVPFAVVATTGDTLHLHAQHPRIALAIAAVLALSVLTAADPTASTPAPNPPPPPRPEVVTSRAARGASPTPAAPDIEAYRGLGAWIDMYDDLPYRRPRLVVADIASRGVKTIYLQTSNYNRPERHDQRIFRRGIVGTIIEAAHRRGMKVVAWSLPSFRRSDHDFVRAMAAIRFRSPNGHRFDGFALDIESDVVRDLDVRNRRMARLSRLIADSVPRDYALGAILPEAGAKYWLDFPYATVGRHYDVFLPMAYATFRTSGYAGVRRFTAGNIREVRVQLRRARVPIHIIGGISEESSDREVRAVVDAANANGVIGTSMYSWDGATDGHWRRLRRLRR